MAAESPDPGRPGEDLQRTAGAGHGAGAGFPFSKFFESLKKGRKILIKNKYSDNFIRIKNIRIFVSLKTGRCSQKHVNTG
jgi:hypothetical protein